MHNTEATALAKGTPESVAASDGDKVEAFRSVLGNHKKKPAMPMLEKKPMVERSSTSR